ncbi:MAG: TIGR04076 family protein [Methanomethylophilus sp.]|nr:TIGR04076 family protein [Methanomethylophilus sp.]
MKDVKITVMRICEHKDLIELYENPIEHACDMKVGLSFVSKNAEKPDGMCDPAWRVMKKYVSELANGKGNFFDGWMKDPHSAMISCDDGFRPVSFYLETIE